MPPTETTRPDKAQRRTVVERALREAVAANSALAAQVTALRRVAVVAKEIRDNQADDIDGRLRYVYIQPDRDEWERFCAVVDALETS
jgi:hypothetical protein